MNRYASKHNLVDLVSTGMDKCELPVKGARYIAGISGGVDSMVLLWILVRLLKVHVVATHINYGKRGAESDADEELVRLFCMENNIPFELLGRADAGSRQNAGSGNFQNQARTLRREFLLSVMNRHDARAIFLAHHKDDQIETIIQKLLRGAAPEKWTGMKRFDPPWMRPLLEASKDELQQFAQEQEIPYRTDRSNLESSYSRNMLRNKIFPLFNQAYPGWDKHVVRLSRIGHLHTSMLDYITGVVTVSRPDIGTGTLFEAPYAGNTEQTDTGHPFSTVLKRTEWLSLSEELQLPVARNWIEKQTGYIGWSKGEVLRLEDLKKLQTGKRVHFDAGFSVQRDREHYVLVQNRASGVSHEISLTRLSITPITACGFMFTENRYDPALQTGALQLNREALDAVILLRKWEKGDRFQPMGMAGRQSVADHLTNRKISSVQKSESLVLVSFEGKVHAVIFPHCLDSGEIGTIAEHTRCHTEGQRVLLIKKPDHFS